MALKKVHAVALEDLLTLAKRFYKFSGDLAKVKEELDADFDELMVESNTKITLIEKDGDLDVEVIELQRDFLKVAHKNEENISIKSKTLGVEIEVKVWRKEKFEHTNAQIKAALLQLAEQIDIIPTESKDIEEEVVIKGIELFQKADEKLESEDEALEDETLEDETLEDHLQEEHESEGSTLEDHVQDEPKAEYVEEQLEIED